MFIEKSIYHGAKTAIYSAICFVFVFTAFENSGWSQKQFGLGVVFGEPTGITGKLWLDPKQAVDAGISFSFSDYVSLYGDYLYHFEFRNEFKPYVGVGGQLFFASDGRGSLKEKGYFSDSSSVALGVRIPLGIEWLPAKVPVGVFLELVPEITMFPNTNGFLQGGIGARYYF